MEDIVGLWTATSLFLEVIVTKRILLLLFGGCRCKLRVDGAILIGIILVMAILEAVVSILGLIILF